MFNSSILDVAIGLALVFILVSTVCTSVREAIESVLKTRAAYLECAIRELLQDPTGRGIAGSFFRHPLISGLFKNEYEPRPLAPTLFARGKDMPSYIPSRNFAATLIDLAARGLDVKQAPTSEKLTLDALRQSVGKLENVFVQRALMSAIDAAQDDLEAVREHLEAWFDAAMDRVSGWYKRTSQVIIALIAVVVVGLLNLDAIAIADCLYRDPAVRAAALAAAERVKPDGLDATTSIDMLNALHLPIGWSAMPHITGYALLLKLLGLALTAFAATLGAPFWFDVLNKVMVIRATVKPHEKSGEEGSEDRALTPSAAAAKPVAPIIQIVTGDGLSRVHLVDPTGALNDSVRVNVAGAAAARAPGGQ